VTGTSGFNARTPRRQGAKARRDGGVWPPARDLSESPATVMNERLRVFGQTDTGLLCHVAAPGDRRCQNHFEMDESGEWRLNVQCRVNEEQNLVSVIQQLHQAVLDCIDREQALPGLALMYATIDILASLERPADQEATGSKEFKRWIENYMPLSALNVTSSDLWAARCGLLHTFTPSSDKSREGKARELHYVRGDKWYRKSLSY
jgi:hypothetical protein